MLQMISMACRCAWHNLCQKH